MELEFDVIARLVPVELVPEIASIVNAVRPDAVKVKAAGYAAVDQRLRLSRKRIAWHFLENLRCQFVQMLGPTTMLAAKQFKRYAKSQTLAIRAEVPVPLEDFVYVWRVILQGYTRHCKFQNFPLESLSPSFAAPL